jgi:AbrB family looped-hinge helix DNA binding protein
MDRRKKAAKMETVVNAKGQITIPAKIRRDLDIEDGTRLQIRVDAVNRQIILTPIPHRLRGRYKGKGLIKSLMVEKEQESGIQYKKNRK